MGRPHKENGQCEQFSIKCSTDDMLTIKKGYGAYLAKCGGTDSKGKRRTQNAYLLAILLRSARATLRRVIS